MKIGVDEEQCIAAGNCALIAPEVFDQNDENGAVIVRDAKPPLELHGKVQEAAAACPARVIHVEE